MAQPPRKMTNVVIAGGTGSLSPATIKHLPKTHFKVAVLTRDPSKAKLPPGVEAIKADYTSAESLSKSLMGRGFDAIIIIPSRRAHQASLVTMQAAVDAAKAAEGEITYTGINTGMFLDMALDKDSFVRLSGNYKTRIHDGGDVPISATTHDDIGKAIVAALMNPDQTVNKVSNIHSVVMTQDQMLEFAHQAASEAEFHVEPVDTKELEDAAWERYCAGQRDPLSVHDFALRAGFGLGNGHLERTDNELLGIEQWSDEGLREEVTVRLARHRAML
ncbi:NmrA domain-containing protein [Fusarium sp. LHS14.1]|nr:NmrA domain-containing protein [Fusarium sp. LHS14.1]